MPVSTRPNFKAGTQPSASGLDAMSRAIFGVRAGRGIDARIDGGQLYIATTGALGVPSEIVPIVAPIYSTDSPINPAFATRGAELRDYFKRVHRLIPLDGSTVDTADYPELALILGEAGATMTLADWRGRFTVGADNAGTPAAHSDSAYSEAMEVGGFRRHGVTENNHRDHVFTVNLEHTHAQPGSATVCLEAATGDPPSCVLGSPTEIAIYTGTPPDAEFPATPTSEAFDPSAGGTITRSGTENELVTIRAKHYADNEEGGGGSAGQMNDTDNRPPWGSAWMMIRF
jgi:hypothetical protein